MTSVPMMGTTSGGGGTSMRWCPTREQVTLLERMYNGGLKNPSTTQIHHITERLSIFGNVQGKNVFYWFQNRKARERQKFKKKLEARFGLHHPNYPPYHQVGRVEGPSSCRTIVNRWKVDFPSDPTCNLKCNCLLMSMMMMDHQGTIPYFTRVPPKTLQLFPVTTTTTHQLKGDDPSSTTNPAEDQV